VFEIDERLLLVADELDEQLWAIDWAGKTARRVGRAGRGPGEYADVGGLYRVGRDSSVLEDANLRRWMLLRRDSIVGVLNPGPRYATDHLLAGAAADGSYLESVPHHFGQSRVMRSPRIRDFADTLMLVLVSGVRRDSIAVLRGSFAGVGIASRRENGVSREYMFYAPFRAEEQALQYHDGWIAVARLSPYRVEWRRPDGTWIRGAPLPFERVPVDGRQQAAELARTWSGSPTLFRPDEMPSWPRELPAFQRNALLPVADGTLLVTRTIDARREVRWHDVVDRSGRLTSRLAVRTNERIVGVGERHLYVAARDEDGVEMLRRYAWRRR
jgi:hypothetical protein